MVRNDFNYTRADGSSLALDTYVGRLPSATTLKRFLVGPVDCELTGCSETPDGKTLFVNIQHPGEGLDAVADIATPALYKSHWPGNAGYGAGGADGTPPFGHAGHHQERRRAHRQLTCLTKSEERVGRGRFPNRPRLFCGLSWGLSWGRSCGISRRVDSGHEPPPARAV